MPSSTPSTSQSSPATSAQPSTSSLADSINQATENFNPADPESVRTVVGLIRTLLNQLGEVVIDRDSRSHKAKGGSRHKLIDNNKKQVQSTIGKEMDNLWKVRIE